MKSNSKDADSNAIGDAPTAGGIGAYMEKSRLYYGGARFDWVAEMPQSASAKILEVGCGCGGTGTLALTERKCGWYAGIELFEAVAVEARSKLNEVICGDVESVSLPWGDGTFDMLLLSEVLEHLVDPWTTLRRLRPLLKVGALIFASSPNVAHYSIISMLIRGRWDLQNSGPMDRTHLRWFTPYSYRNMFESTGFAVKCVKPHVRLGPKARILNYLTFGQFRHSLHRQIDLRACRS